MIIYIMYQILLCSLVDIKKLLNELEDRLIIRLKNNYEDSQISKEWLTTNEVSKLLDISLTTVHAWSNQAILHKYKIGNKTRFKKEEVLSALTKLEEKNRWTCKK